MFCSSCGTANADGATTCRVCGEPLTQQRPSRTPEATLRKWGSENAKWLWLAVVALLAAASSAVYYYRASQEFEVTGEVLYKNEMRVRPVAGAFIQVLQERGSSTSPDARNAELSLLRNNRYALLLMRQYSLNLNHPGLYDSARDVELAALRLAPLSKMDWTWWESERLRNCRWAAQVFSESLQSPLLVATTSTDMNGRFWLKLKRGRYFITAESEVPSFLRIQEGPFGTADPAQPVTGGAFWNIPVTVTGNMKVISAEAGCSPD